MKIKFYFMAFVAMLITSCVQNEFEDSRDSRIEENVQKVFGTTFDKTHDWCSTVNGNVKITVNPSDFPNVEKVQILTCSPFGNGDGNGATILNEAEAYNGDVITLYYDVPKNIEKLYAMCISSDGKHYIKGFKVNESEVKFNSKDVTRAIPEDVKAMVNSLPKPTLGKYITSYAMERGYEGFTNDLYYNVNGIRNLMMSLVDYDEEAKEDLRDIIFTYLPNKESNIEKIKEHQYYNETSYAITTGDDPIVVEAIYKNDGGYHEVEYCSMYYYYFKATDIAYMSREEQVEYFKGLPKFKLMSMYDIVKGKGVSTGLTDDELKRNAAYTVVYWGDGELTEGMEGSYQFPKGYKIGFVLRNEGKEKHQGELYCDGGLNNEVNKWRDLASSELGDNDARMAWLSGNKKYFLCCECGTDRDFNDIVFEVEGGIEPIGEDIDLEYNTYTFCFEDRMIGDYDMNDVVIKAKRLNETQVEYTVLACGASDELFIYNIEGKRINNSIEVHEMFGSNTRQYINTEINAERFEPIKDTLTVKRTFSFLSNMPYIYDKTMNYTVKISRKGEDPHAIMIPNDFKYPLEWICIKDAYRRFNEWGENQVLSTDWFTEPKEDKVWN